ncbi:MAG: VCBS repeat-containing protein [Acidobacteria bacterium]|nr:VCBS repeat-containing protein [Acidobacteriota bacterium]
MRLTCLAVPILIASVTGCRKEEEAPKSPEARPASLATPAPPVGSQTAVAEGPAPAKSSSLDPRVYQHNNLGIAHLEQRSFAQAAEEFQKALEIDPGFLLARVNLGIAYFNLPEYEKAEAAFKKALEADPGQPHVRYGLGLIYKNQNKLDQALQEFRMVLSQDPADPSTHYNLGQLYVRKRDYHRAIEHFRKALDVEPRNASAHYSLAQALLRSGEQQEGEKELRIFQQLQREGPGPGQGTLVGVQYLEQGKYSIAVEAYPAEASDAAIAVAFREVTAPAGIGFQHAAGNLQSHWWGRLDAATYSKAWAEANLVPFMGSGAAFGDYDGDGRLDLYLVNCGPDPEKARNQLYRNNGNGSFREVTDEAGVRGSGRGMSGLWGDYDGDGDLDLYVLHYGPNILYRNEGNGRFSDVTAEAAVGDPAWSVGGAWADYDHDGDLDLYVANFVDLESFREAFVYPRDFKGQPNSLYRNNGNGTFTEVARDAKVDGGDHISTGVVFTDFNNSRDIDLYVTGPDLRGNILFSNLRDGTFANVTEAMGLWKGIGAIAATVGDYDTDGWMDLFESMGPSLESQLLSNRAAKAFTASPWLSKQPAGFWNAQFFDYDNDGRLDLLLIQDSGGLRLFRNGPGEKFEEVTQAVGLSRFSGAFRGATVGDYDGDGDLDFFVMVNGGSPLLLRNDGGNRNHWIKLKLVGRNDNRWGVGSKVEVKAGLLAQKIEVTAGQGYQSQASPEVHFGLGQRDRVDFVRVLWPTGVLQSEINLRGNKTTEVQELDRKGTSCPILYAWNGQRYQFVTDFLGGSAVGYLTSPGHWNYPDTDEYVRLTADQLRERGGRYSILMNDQLEEVIWLDQVKLLAIDHPADLEVYPDERLMPGPPFPEFRIYPVRHPRPPLAARDDRGRDVLPLISKVDRRYPEGFHLLRYKGYAEPHSLELDLGDLSSAKQITLLMTAWIDYADSTANLAASQAGLKLIPPYLEVRDGNGKWVRAMPQMGFPAGLPKTMVVDLTGKFPARDYRVRITTNMRIYWDQILVDTYAGKPDLKIHTLSPLEADLHWRGYPREYSPDGRQPLLYDYSRIKQEAPWKSHVGRYTRYGDVRELLEERDDRYVTLLHGDEVRIEFDTTRVSPPAPGWKRTFFVYADGLGKDMDLNSARPDRVEPLPFHGMTAYPYPATESYPRTPEHLNYLRRYQTRVLDDVFDDGRRYRKGDIRSTGR